MDAGLFLPRTRRDSRCQHPFATFWQPPAADRNPSSTHVTGVRGSHVQAVARVSQRLPVQVPDGQVRDALLPPQRRPVWQHLPRHLKREVERRVQRADHLTLDSVAAG